MQEHQKAQATAKAIEELPSIPNKVYFTIGEVSQLCNLRPHVLRYWEQEFSQLKPSKRRGNRRYYQHSDVVMIRRIKDLLYNQGYTIEGARIQLINEATPLSPPLHHPMRTVVGDAITELEAVLEELE